MSLTLAAISIIEEDQIGGLDEAELVQACHHLAAAQQDSGDRFGVPQPWRGVRAKAVALKSLLQSGHADLLHDDASAPDRLAWSLVQDLLALMPSVLRLPTPEERRPILTSA